MRMWRKGNAHALLGKTQTDSNYEKQYGISSKKLKMELPFDSAVLLLGLYPKNPETPIQNYLYIPMFIADNFTIAKCWKQPKCPSPN